VSSKRAIRRRSCTGKVRHTSQANAEVARRVMVRAGRAAPGTLNAYRCSFCGGYHVGTRPGTGGLRPA